MSTRTQTKAKGVIPAKAGIHSAMDSRFRGNDRRSRGFTLMEALLAILIFSLVIASSTSIFSQGLSIWKRSRGISRAEKKTVLALEKMAMDIQNTLYIKEKEERLGDRDIEVSGNSQSFKLPSIVSLRSRKGDEVFTQYGAVSYEWDSGKKSLCRSQQTATDLFLGQKPQCVPLADSIEKFRLRYYVYAGIGNSYSWYDQFRYKKKEGLPVAVEIKLTVFAKSVTGKITDRKDYERLVLLPVGGKPPSTTP